MSKTMRSVDTRFWKDSWVRKLNALDRYAFLYFMTNTHTTWCGVYELDLSMAAFESGIDERDLMNTIVPRLSPKLIYVDNWIYIPNWQKYHMSGSGNLSPQQQKGLVEAWKLVPSKIMAQIKAIEEKGIPSIEGIGGVLASASASASTISESYDSQDLSIKEKDMSWGTRSDDFEEGTVDLDGDGKIQTQKKPSTRKYPNAPAICKIFQEVLGRSPANWKINKNQLTACENLYTERTPKKVRSALQYFKENESVAFCPKINSPYDLDAKWTNLGDFKIKNS